MLAGCETQTDWYQVPNDQQFDRLVGLGEDQSDTLLPTTSTTRPDANLEAL